MTTGMTPLRGSQTPVSLASGRTPVRDMMQINSGSEDIFASERQRMIAARRSVLEGLSKLPAPQNEYSAEMPQDDEDEEGVEDADDMEVSVDRVNLFASPDLMWICSGGC